MFLFQNLLEKPEEKKNEASLSMIQCKLLPVSKLLHFFLIDLYKETTNWQQQRRFSEPISNTYKNSVKIQEFMGDNSLKYRRKLAGYLLC